MQFHEKVLWLQLQCLLILMLYKQTSVNGECDGTRKSERIKETLHKYIDAMPGSRVVMNWTWCYAVNSTVTGIVIFRVSRGKSRIPHLNHILSMDLSNTVHYLKDNLKHELRTENETSFQQKTIFIINNASRVDNGTYSLHVRREGHIDLHSEVQVIVKATDEDPTTRLLTTSTTEARELVPDNNESQLKKSNQRKTESNLLLIISLSVVGGVIMTVILFFIAILKRRIKMHAIHRGGIERQVLYSGSSQGNLSKETLTTSDKAALVIKQKE